MKKDENYIKAEKKFTIAKEKYQSVKGNENLNQSDSEETEEIFEAKQIYLEAEKKLHNEKAYKAYEEAECRLKMLLDPDEKLT